MSIFLQEIAALGFTALVIAGIYGVLTLLDKWDKDRDNDDWSNPNMNAA